MIVFSDSIAERLDTMTDVQKKLRVGIVGAGEVAQVIHLPVLSMLSQLYSVSIVCDLSKKVEPCFSIILSLFLR